MRRLKLSPLQDCEGDNVSVTNIGGSINNGGNCQRKQRYYQKGQGEIPRTNEHPYQKGITISTMESITSGLVASLITDTEGSSAVLKEAFITYSNEAKIREGVSAGVIRRYSVYHV